MNDPNNPISQGGGRPQEFTSPTIPGLVVPPGWFATAAGMCRPFQGTEKEAWKVVRERQKADKARYLAKYCCTPAVKTSGRACY